MWRLPAAPTAESPGLWAATPGAGSEPSNPSGSQAGLRGAPGAAFPALRGAPGRRSVGTARPPPPPPQPPSPRPRRCFVSRRKRAASTKPARGSFERSRGAPADPLTCVRAAQRPARSTARGRPSPCPAGRTMGRARSRARLPAARPRRALLLMLRLHGGARRARGRGGVPGGRLLAGAARKCGQRYLRREFDPSPVA